MSEKTTIELSRKFRGENLVAVIALIIIIFISSSTQLEIYYPWLAYYGTRSVLNYLIPYNILLLLLYVNYFITMFTNPGVIPKDFNKAIESEKKKEKEKRKEKKNGSSNDDNIPLNEILNRKKNIVLEGYLPKRCDKCKNYKPARTHHCNICNRCVLRMDHHCPWVANCIGNNNVAYFGRFLFYVTVLCSYNLVLIGMRILGVINYQNHQRDLYSENYTNNYYVPILKTKEMVFIVVDLIMLFLVILLVTPLFVFQVMYATSNTSTIEDREIKKMNELIEKKEVPNVKYPYDYGWLNNLKEVYGSNILNWFINGRTQGDGIHFKINVQQQENKERYEVYWPPKEYYQYKRVRKYEKNDTEDENQTKGTRNFNGHTSKHVRRGSEGYIVRTTTERERERMVQRAILHEERNRKKNIKKALEEENGHLIENGNEMSLVENNNEQIENENENENENLDYITDENELYSELESEYDSELDTEIDSTEDDSSYDEWSSDEKYKEKKIGKIRVVDTSDLWSDEEIDDIKTDDNEFIKDKDV